MKRTILIISAIILVLLSVGGFFYVRGTPHYSIYLLVRAVNDRDPDKALQYIDVDSLVESAVKNMYVWDGAMREKTKRAIASGISMNMGSIKEGIRQYIVSSIRSGEASTRAAQEGGGIGLGNFNIPQVKKNVLWDLSIDVEGGTAYVRLKDRPDQRAKMIKTKEGYWKFTEVAIDARRKD